MPLLAKITNSVSESILSAPTRSSEPFAGLPPLLRLRVNILTVFVHVQNHFFENENMERKKKNL